ncbi:MAG: redox-sensitive transcriptional activator SoxR [Dehalococcoidia bacterium]
MALPNTITITELSQRSGVQASALRFYESIGLIDSERTGGNHRRYPRATLRVVSVIRVAQGLGLSLREIADALKSLPDGRSPTAEDWERMSTAWGEALDARIGQLQQLRDDLSECIGCGCLSLERCALFNTDDRAARKGAGPRYLLGDRSEQA